MNLYIVRHGQTFTNLNNIVCGQYNTTMTELGHSQVQESCKILKNKIFHHCYTSSLSRAKETASYFDNIENFMLVDDIKEMNTGDFSELKVDKLWEIEPKLKYQGRFQYQEYPNGESLNILYNRITSWFQNNITTQWKENENILVVGHEATVVCAIHYFLQIPLENYPSFRVKNGGIIKIDCDFNDNQYRVEFL